MSIAQNKNAPMYLRLNKGGAFLRLVELRAIVAESTRGNRPPSHAIADWRAARQYGFHNWADAHAALSQGTNTENAGTPFEEKSHIWYCHTGEQFRNETYIDMHDDVSVSHRGWYADADCNEVLRAFVFNLPHGRFGCGYANSDTGERVYLNSVHDDAQNAANFADCEAERIAEEAKEYDERWQAASKLRDEIDDKKREVLHLYLLRNNATADCREECRDELAELRSMLDRLATEFADVEY